VKGLQADILKQAVAENNAVELDVVVHQSIDSTNSWVMQHCKAGRNLPVACFAEEQMQGRGRRGKQWLMPANSNIAMSMVWPFSLAHQQLHLLPISIAIAIAETLESYSLEHVQIKWPNDVYVKGKKIAGILIETQTLKSEMVAVVIGVGLNYDMSSLNEKDNLQLLAEVKSRCTDVTTEIEKQAIKQKPERTEVASILLKNIVKVCQNYQQESKCYLERFRKQYDYCKEKNVEITLDNQETLTGIAKGVTDNAELIVFTEGSERIFNSAEVSVRPGQF